MIDPELQMEIRKAVVAEFEARRTPSPTPDQVAIWEKNVRALKWKAASCLLGSPLAFIPWVVIALALHFDPKAMPYMVVAGVLSVIASGFLCWRFYQFDNLHSRLVQEGP